VAAAASHLSPRPIEIWTHTDEEMRACASPALHRPRLSQRQEKLARLVPLEPAPPPNVDAERIHRRLTAPYPHRAFTRLAASQTVGALTKTGRTTFAGEHASREQIVRFGQELPAPRCVLESLSASALEVGATTHLVLQHLDFSRPCTRDDVKQQVAQMVARKHVVRAEADLVDVDAIVWLVSTDLGKLLRSKWKDLQRELPVFFPMQVEPSDEPLDRVMVRGRLDVMVPTDDGIVLVDYKTDRVTRDTIDARAEFYRSQVESYSRAIEAIVGKHVRTAYLVFLHARELRTVKNSA
jgi:ATP-dependent helicase/nuclease subunit A